MSFQPINLGTPNNNDGDSLYAGGFKINANFAELYTSISGSSSGAIRLNLQTPVINTALFWDSAADQFVPASSNAVRTVGQVGENVFFITDNSGVAGGADGNLSGPANSAVWRMEGRGMMSLGIYNNINSASTRGVLDINLGNSSVTVLSAYTSGVVVRGVNGLTIRGYDSQDNPADPGFNLLTSQTSGVTLFRTPVLDFATMSPDVRSGADSSNAVAHTGFIKSQLTRYVLSSTSIRAQRGVVGTNPDGTLGSSTVLTVDGVYHPKHCEGLIYNYNSTDNKVTLVTGAAAHWAYSTSGVPILAPTTAIAIVASYNPIIRSFRPGWTPQYNTNGSSNAVIDSTILPNTWYYLYYLGCLIYTSSLGTGVGSEFYPGSSNVVISSNRDIASVDAQLRDAGYGGVWQVVRRLGPLRTDGSGDPRPLPFNIKRIDHGAFEYYWGLNPNGSGSPNGADTSYTLTITSPPQLRIVGSSTAFTLQSYNSAVLTAVPPIPGITAHLTIRHRTIAPALPEMYMYGESWTVNSSISTLFPPFEVIRSTCTAITCVHNVQLPMSPDGCYIPDGTYNGAGILSVTTSTGLIMRYIFQNPATEGFKTQVTSQLLQITTTGFRLAR
jgi:hypothetical protein